MGMYRRRTRLVWNRRRGHQSHGRRRVTPCVCGHHPERHHAGTGACDGGCGCSYWLEDCGIEPFAPTPGTEPYRGIYANRKWSA